MNAFNRTCLGLLMMLVLSGVSACNRPAETVAKEVALKVNGSEISVREFNEQIKLDAYTDPEMDITRETRERFADYLVQRELMLQVAVRMQLDKKAAFVKTIERYWESTLIRSLLDLKTAELKQDVLVTREEVEAYYLAHKDEYGQPFEAVKDGIKSILEARHLEKKLETWTKELRASADITVNNDYIKGQ